MADRDFYNNYLQYLNDIEKMNKGGNTIASSGGGNSGTISSEELVLSDSGGGGGAGGGGYGGMISAFTDLGDKLHKNTLSTIDMFHKMKQNRIRQPMLDAEAKREFNVNQGNTVRGQNLSSLGYLAGLRTAAGQQASSRLPFRDALAMAVR